MQRRRTSSLTRRRRSAFSGRAPHWNRGGVGESRGGFAATVDKRNEEQTSQHTDNPHCAGKHRLTSQYVSTVNRQPSTVNRKYHCHSHPVDENITVVSGISSHDANATSVTFRKGERIDSPRGRGVIRQGYASGEIVEYEIAGDDGTAFMANQSEMRRP
jgi:hypothetical protein